jgi:hypothetical protein
VLLLCPQIISQNDFSAIYLEEYTHLIGSFNSS